MVDKNIDWINIYTVAFMIKKSILPFSLGRMMPN